MLRSCRACGYYARYFSSLIVHARTHTQEKPYKCSECDYGSTQHSNLKKHEAIHRRSQLLANQVAQAPIPGAITEDTLYSNKVCVLSDPRKAAGLADAAVATDSAQPSGLTSTSLSTLTGEHQDRNQTHALLKKVFHSLIFKKVLMDDPANILMHPLGGVPNVIHRQTRQCPPFSLPFGDSAARFGQLDHYSDS